MTGMSLSSNGDVVGKWVLFLWGLLSCFAPPKCRTAPCWALVAVPVHGEKQRLVVDFGERAYCGALSPQECQLHAIGLLNMVHKHYLESLNMLQLGRSMIQG